MKEFYIMYRTNDKAIQQVESFDVLPGEERPFDVETPLGWEFRCWTDQVRTTFDRIHMNSINFTLPS